MSTSVELAAVSAEQKTRFERDGYLAFPTLIDAGALVDLRGYYDRIIAREIDCGENDRMLGGLTRQVMHPSKFHSYFRENPVLAAARAIARDLLDCEPVFYFDMLINKMPGNHNPTPWHQDYAYSAMPFLPKGTPIYCRTLQFWVALDDVDVSNGCMHFIPGAHRGSLLEHFVYSGDPADEGRLLATREVDESKAVPCPLPAGGCTVHSEGAPHFTSGNTTRDRQRRAYIFNLCHPDHVANRK